MSSAGREAELEGIRYDQLAGEPPSQPESPRQRTTLSDDGWDMDPAPLADFGPSGAASGAGDGSPAGSSKRMSPRAALHGRRSATCTLLTCRKPVCENVGDSCSHKLSTVRRQTLAAKSFARESRARKSSWTCIYSTGVKSILHSDKRGVIQKFKLGVPIRDMRLLDPNLLTSETGKILVRDNAIVLSIEHVRLIVTADVAIAPREGFERNPLNVNFNRLLEEAVAEFAAEAAQRSEAARAAPPGAADILKGVQGLQGFQSDDDASSEHQHEVAPLPFELHVLEVALKDICQLASALTKDLDAVAHPALDALTKSVTTSNLERVRKVKTRHQRLHGRVSTVREELQRFLEDDDDMVKMCLTRKKELELAGGGQVPQGRSAEMGSVGLPGGRRHSLSVANATPRQATPFLAHAHQGSPPWQAMERAGSEVEQVRAADDESESAEAVENLLESYFMQIDASYDRLDAIGEFIEDTEEYINIELDSSRNRLLRLEIVLTAATFAIAMFSLVAGILGENLVLPKRITTDLAGFIYVNLGTLAICFLFFSAIIGYVRYRRLM